MSNEIEWAGEAPVQRMPYAEMEQNLLGALLADPSKIPVARAEISPDVFQDGLHARIFAVLASWDGSYDTITPISVAAALRGDSSLTEMGGRNYLATLAMASPALPNIAHLAALIRSERLREDAMAACDGAVHALMTSATPVHQALRQVMVVADEASRASGSRKPKGAHAVSQVILERAEAALGGNRLPAVPTGLYTLDQKLGGFFPTDLIIVPGRSGAGKSALMNGIALRAALVGYPALVLSLEMGADQCMVRDITDLDFDAHPFDAMAYQDYRRGTWLQSHVARAAEASRLLHDIPLEICDAGDLTVEDIAALARAFKAKHGNRLGIVVVDYLQIVASSVGRDRSREQEVAHVARGLKGLAKMLEWPVVAGAQLLTKGQSHDQNRGAKGSQYKEQIPTLAAVRESGSIETEADIIIAPHRKAWFHTKNRPDAPDDSPEIEQWKTEYRAIKNSMRLYGLKNRHGAEFALDLFCEMRSSAIRCEKPLARQSAEVEQAQRDLLVQ